MTTDFGRLQPGTLRIRAGLMVDRPDPYDPSLMIGDRYNAKDDGTLCTLVVDLTTPVPVGWPLEGRRWNCAPLPVPPVPIGLLDFADFFALMPGDNAATIALGSPVLFPQDGPTAGLGISRLTPGLFELGAGGVYRVTFQVSVDEPGQLQLELNGLPVPTAVFGRATGTSQIMGDALITVAPLSVLGVINPPSNAAALTITPIAGGTVPVSAHLVIERLS